MHEIVPPPTIQPDIFWYGLRIAEPVIALTALMITAVCWYAWRRLARTAQSNAVVWYIRAFFLLIGGATLVGGLIGHAFLYHFGFHWKIPGWVLSMLGVAALERAAILHAKPLIAPFWGRFFSVMNVVELVAIMYLALATLNFHYVEVHTGYGLMIVVGLFEGFVYWKTRDAGSRLILLAIPIMIVAVVVHLAYFSFSVWFTYFDIGHVLMCMACWSMMLGAERMQFYDKIRAYRIRA